MNLYSGFKRFQTIDRLKKVENRAIEKILNQTNS